MIGDPAMNGPLEGVRVVEFAGIGPGPYACLLLAELGAQVLRLDRLDAPGAAGASHGLTRSRPNIAVDLKSAEGRELALSLIDTADILIEGNRPGVMERLGLGPQPCRQRNPGLIYGRMTGWGQDGPYRAEAGHDINYAGLAGALHMVGTRDKPMAPVNLLADFGGGSLFLVTGVLAALHERGRSGLGQVVDAAMVDGAASLTTMMHTMLAAGRWRDERQANYLDGAAPFYDTYRCADGRFVAVGAIEPQFYRALVHGLDVQHQLKGEQRDESTWPAHRELFAERFATRSRDEWVRAFAGTDACVTAVLSMAEAPHDPHLRARGTFVPVEGALQPAVAPRFSRTPGRAPSPPRPVGADTVTALLAWGIGRPRIDALLAAGAIRQNDLTQ
jgi:alpha-methylacyl-CoA racemase